MERSVTPWICKSEWEEVSDHIQSLEATRLFQAEEIILSWQHRVSRLPTGAEATLCLIQAALSWCRNPNDRTLPLSISAALIRFLNLSSHVGLNKFDLTKLQDVAKIFNIPEFLVELRHDAAHGEMKSKNSLIEGLALALHWVIKNYWQWNGSIWTDSEVTGEDGEELNFILSEEQREYKTAGMWLECYQYLTTYSLWGNKTIGEIKENSDTYEHIVDLWTQLRLKSSDHLKSPKSKRSKIVKSIADDCLIEPRIVENIDSMSLSSANGQIRQRIEKWLSSGYNDSAGGTIAKVLVNQNLLLPDREFLESLLEPGEDIAMIRSEKRVPNLLLQTWNLILNEIAKTKGLLCSLTLNLHKVCCEDSGNDEFSRDLASAWICEILKAVVQGNSIGSERKPSKDKKNKNSKRKEKKHWEFVFDVMNWKTDHSWQDFVLDVLLYPNDRTFSYLPFVLKLKIPQFSISEEKQIMDLTEIYLGKKLSKKDKVPEESIKSLSSLVTIGCGEEMKWRLIDEIPWQIVPFGLCPGQSEEDFLTSIRNLDCESSTSSLVFSQSKLSFLDEFPLTAKPVDWNNLSKKRKEPRILADGTPAFYR